MTASVTIGVGISDEVDPLVAFDEASRQAAAELGGESGQCDLAVVFASAPHLGHAKPLLDRVHANLSPAHLIGCGAGGVVAAGRELEDGPGAAVWAMSASGGELATHHLTVERDGEPGTQRLAGLPEPDALGDALLVLADPYTFSADALLEALNSQRPGAAGARRPGQCRRGGVGHRCFATARCSTRARSPARSPGSSWSRASRRGRPRSAPR